MTDEMEEIIGILDKYQEILDGELVDRKDLQKAVGDLCYCFKILSKELVKNSEKKLEKAKDVLGKDKFEKHFKEKKENKRMYS